MAEVLIAALPDGIPDGPGQSTSSSGQKSIILALGPIKEELVFLQQDSDDDFAASDTFTTKLARPFAVSVVPINRDLTDTAFPGSVTGEFREANASFKTITLLDCDGLNGQGVLVRILGY